MNIQHVSILRKNDLCQPQRHGIHLLAFLFKAKISRSVQIEPSRGHICLLVCFNRIIAKYCKIAIKYSKLFILKSVCVYIYILGCCSNTFLAGLFRRLSAVVFVILNCLVYCYFCVRVLLFFHLCSVIFAFVFCHLCVRVLQFLHLCSVIFEFVFCYFCVCVLLLLSSCSVITEHKPPFYRTQAPFLQNTRPLFTKHGAPFDRTRDPFL